MAVLNDGVNQLERFLDIGANEIIQVLTTVVAVGAIFVVLDPSVAMLAIAPMPLTRLGETFDQYQRAMASTNRILDARRGRAGRLPLPLHRAGEHRLRPGRALAPPSSWPTAFRRCATRM
jgi:hypothetical protein